jgi:hypothetical protein
MKTLLEWLVAAIIASLFFLPFILFYPIKRKWLKIYLALGTILSAGIFIWYFFEGSDKLIHSFVKMDPDIYYFFDDSAQYAIYVYLLIILLSPFIFTKILYGRTTVKRFFVSLLLSFLIFIALALIFAYYIVPKAGSVLLHNI